MEPFSEHARREHEGKELLLLEQINKGVWQGVLILSDIRSLLKQKPILIKAKVIIMPKTIPVGGTAQAAIQGFDQNGKPVVLDSTYTVTPSASAPSDVSFSPVNPDGSFTVVGVNADPGDSIGASITRPDGSVIQASADVLTVTAAASVLATANVVLS